jgi:hypothetical protein
MKSLETCISDDRPSPALIAWAGSATLFNKKHTRPPIWGRCFIDRLDADVATTLAPVQLWIQQHCEQNAKTQPSEIGLGVS